MADKQQFLNAVTSVKILEEWAQTYNMVADEEVNLKRIELLTASATRNLQPESADNRHRCNTCSKTFSQKKNLFRHVRSLHMGETYKCEKCGQAFNRIDKYTAHTCRNAVKRRQATVQSSESTKRPCLRPLDNNINNNSRDIPARLAKCNWCGHVKCLLPGKHFCVECSSAGRECQLCRRPLPERFYSHRVDVCDSCVRRRERWNAKRQIGGGEVKQALQGAVSTVTLLPSDFNRVDILQFFADNQNNIESILSDFLKTKTGMKWFLTLKINFVKYNENNEQHIAEPILRSTNFTITNTSQLDDEIAQAFQKLYTASQEFQAEGSGWSIDSILHLEVNTAEYVPLSGSSYFPLPNVLTKKKAILNIQNEDQKCFIWSVLAALHPLDRKQHAERVGNYQCFESELHLKGIDMPIPINQISKFEDQNELSINVFGYDEKDGVFPMYISSCVFSQEIDLLLLSQGEKRHFCLIKHFSRLMGDRTKHDGKTFYCRRCLHGFCRRELLQDHTPYCTQRGVQKIRLPTEETKWVTFSSIHKQLRVPFVIYADFESITTKISGCTPTPDASYTTEYQKHEPSGFCYKIVASDSKFDKAAVVYRGPDVIKHFIDCLLKEERVITNILQNPEPMNLTDEEEKSFHMADMCHICHSKLGQDRVRDHDHLSGVFRGAAHKNCNLNFKFKKNSGKRNESDQFFIPVIFHNLKGYDSHLIIKQLDKTYKGKIDCIASNMEKYISFSLGCLRFIDSLQFLNASLDTLVTNLKAEGTDKFRQLKREFCSDQIDLLLRKGVYPYDFMDEKSKFNLTSLPAKETFYNLLTDSHISESDYEHAQNVWAMFNLQTMGDYHDLYMKGDVILLADVFENFRDLCLEYYGLDSAHYYTLPGLGWDAMLKMGDVELELLTDLDMHLMIEEGLRGGISTITKKYAKANNPLLKDYNKEKPSTHLIYWDANNLYGWAMSQSLPERDFEWVGPQDLEHLDVSVIPENSDVGYILEVDLEYPNDLHDSHNDYPLAPESTLVTENMLSQHSQELKKKLCIKGQPVKKLVPNLNNKYKYVLHYRNLKFYLTQGLILKKIYKAIRFTQSPWLKPYIDFNTKKRKAAKNETEKAFFKLANNSCFGRSMMNVRKHVHVELVNTKKRLRKLCSKPTFEAFKIFNPDLAAVHLKKTSLYLNQPLYAGFSILDVSKILMYDFHYNFIREKYGDKAQLCFTDTDSLLYEIETSDIYTDMLQRAELFDTSNYEPNHPLYSKSNAKVLGKFKDELGGGVMQEFIGLRSKMYSLSYDGKDKMTAKGVSKTVIKKQLRHSMYKHCLFDNVQLRHEMRQIHSQGHQLYSVCQNKISLSPFDDKRYIMADGIHTLAHGHYKIHLI